jgi:hypothetical protein
VFFGGCDVGQTADKLRPMSPQCAPVCLGPNARTSKENEDEA